jgi:8-oxo-dGTP pyrophosphatase MutT (NUDIX family)
VTTRAESPQQPAEPRHAATVILLREQRGNIEVLLTRRHEQMSFMGGMWVFPGGALCPADTSTAALALIAEPEKLGCERFVDPQGQALPQPLCLGLALAACRETFEETGVLLATTAEGHDVRGELLARMHERRRAIVSQPELFATFLQEEHLRIDIERLLYWAHWITPSAVAKRFDTRFFVARLPPEQVPAIDAIEATEMVWMTPAALIAAARDAAMTLSPPTLFNLMELDASVRQHVSLDAIFAAEMRRVIVAVLPKIVRGERSMIVMPWDAEYHKLTGVGASLENSYPERLRALSSRVFTDR